MRLFLHYYNNNSYLFQLCSFVEKHHDTILQLFLFDSRLLTLIPYICPQKDTSLLCELLPTDLAIVWLIEKLWLNSYLRLTSINENKVKSSGTLKTQLASLQMEHYFKKPMACIMQKILTIEIKGLVFYLENFQLYFFL